MPSFPIPAACSATDSAIGRLYLGGLLRNFDGRMPLYTAREVRSKPLGCCQVRTLSRRKGAVTVSVAKPITLPLIAVLMLFSACASQDVADDSSVDSSAEFSAPDNADKEWALIAEKFPDAIRPDVKRIRTVTPWDAPAAIAKCLQDAGFDATVGAGGGVEMEYPVAQEEANVLAQYSCDVQYPVDEKYRQPFNDAQVIELYDYFAGEYTDCLEGVGVRVGDPPSKGVFVDTFETDFWEPLIAAYHDGALDYEKYQEAAGACEQIPREIYE